MRRYWVQTSDFQGDQVFFRGDTFHHIFDVCRQEVGSEFEVLTEDSKAYHVRVDHVGKKDARAQVIGSRELPALPRPHVHLALSISRFPVMDAVIEKAVEMGVKSIQPLFSEHSFVRKSEGLSSAKTERWDKIIKSATQQSGRGDLMQIHEPKNLLDFVENINRTQGWLGLFAYEGDSPTDIRTYLQNEVLAKQLSPEDLWIFVGSEGGFSKPEVDKMQMSGLKPVTLGHQVLRVETACVTLVSILKYDFNLWK